MILIQKISDWLNWRLEKMKQACYVKREAVWKLLRKKIGDLIIFILNFFDDNRTMEILR